MAVSIGVVAWFVLGLVTLRVISRDELRRARLVLHAIVSVPLAAVAYVVGTGAVEAPVCPVIGVDCGTGSASSGVVGASLGLGLHLLAVVLTERLPASPRAQSLNAPDVTRAGGDDDQGA